MSTGIRGESTDASVPDETYVASVGIAFIQPQNGKITLHLSERVTAGEVTEQDGLVSSRDAWLILIQNHGTAQQHIERTRVRTRLEQRPSERINDTHEGSASGRVEDPRRIIDIRGIESTIDANEIAITNGRRSSRSSADRGTRHDALHVARGRTTRNHAGNAAPVPLAERVTDELVKIERGVLQFGKTHLHNTC